MAAVRPKGTGHRARGIRKDRVSLISLLPLYHIHYKTDKHDIQEMLFTYSALLRFIMYYPPHIMSKNWHREPELQIRDISEGEES